MTGTRRPLADHHGGRVMGTTARVVVHGGSSTAAMLFDELGGLERRWSRFLDASELTGLNRSAGALTVVSPATYRLVEHLVAAHHLTGGRFDPTLLAHLVWHGYDRSYRELAEVADRASAPSAPLGRADEIELIDTIHAVVLPPGVQLDPGGLGKGLAADLVADLAVERGAAGVLVDVGGDVVTRGPAPEGGPWRIAVRAGDGEGEQVGELDDGAVATSDTAARTWTAGGRRHQHILDPATGSPLDVHLTATVVAGAGWWAEAVATAAIVSRARHDGWFTDRRAAELGVTAWVTEHEPTRQELTHA